MCECPGYINVHANICSGCERWRKKYGWPLDKPCTENIGTVARSMERDLCHYCNEALIRFNSRTTTPPPQPALTAGAAAAAATADATPVDAISQSSRGSQQQVMPPAAATPQLDQICARLENICGRMEAMMEAMVAQKQVSQAQAAVGMPGPPGLAAPAVAQLAHPHPQAAAPLQAVQAQVVGTVVDVNVPGDHGGQRTHPPDRATSIPPFTPSPIRRPNTM